MIIVFLERLPSGSINRALGCLVKKLGSTPLSHVITDGLTSDDNMIVINTTETATGNVIDFTVY